MRPARWMLRHNCHTPLLLLGTMQNIIYIYKYYILNIMISLIKIAFFFNKNV